MIVSACNSLHQWPAEQGCLVIINATPRKTKSVMKISKMMAPMVPEGKPRQQSALRSCASTSSCKIQTATGHLDDTTMMLPCCHHPSTSFST